MKELPTVLLWLSGGIVFLLIVEHVLKINLVSFRPSTFFQWISQQSKCFFVWIGENIARLSSFVIYVKDFLKELWSTLYELLKPLVEIVFSPLFAIKGYIGQMYQYRYFFLIPLGTSLVATLLLFSLWYYFDMFADYNSRWWATFAGVVLILICAWVYLDHVCNQHQESGEMRMRPDDGDESSPLLNAV